MRSHRTPPTAFAMLMLGLVLSLLIGTILPGPGVPPARADDDDGDDEVSEALLDDLALLLSWAGGGASGTLGTGCSFDTSSPPVPVCEISRNDLLRASINDAITTRGWPESPAPTMVLRLTNGRELQPSASEGGLRFWWIPLDAPIGRAALVMRQANRTAQVDVQITMRQDPPLIVSAWDKPGAAVPTELETTGRPGDSLRVRLAGFAPDQEVALLLFRLVESRALGSFAVFDRGLATIQAGNNGQETFRWETGRDLAPGRYGIHTVPRAHGIWLISEQGSQVCVASRAASESCPTETEAVGPDEVIRPMVQRSVQRAAHTWSDVAGSPSRPASLLDCVYEGEALTARQRELQTLRTTGSRLEAALTRTPRVESIVEARPGEPESGILVTVRERWGVQLHRRDGSTQDIGPARQTWRYHMARGGNRVSTPADSPCGAELVITAMERVD